MSFSKRLMPLAAIGLCAAAGVRAQYSYPNCAPITNKDFAVTPVVNRALNPDLYEPLKMDFAVNDQGGVDIFFIERKGSIKLYDAKAKTVKLLDTLTVETGGEDGLTGFALDPAFKTKKRIYLYYAAKTAFRVSRFDMDPATLKLNKASEKILLNIPSGRGRWHTSGAMRFDAYGDLYINVGDNESLLKGPANTGDLRGGILRIHPDESARGYSIPAGNLWETAAKYFEGKGMADVAAKYRDTTKAKRETFVKGTRNAYTLTVDPVRRWATWGDCGPDQEPGSTPDSTLWTEEHNVATVSGYYGWPFWTALNHVQKVFPPGYDEPGEKETWGDWTTQNPDAPKNTLPEAPIADLPPAHKGTHSYAHACAMTGPIYRYDGDSKSTVKLPPSFNRLWIVTDFDKGTMNAVKLNDAGTQVVGADVPVFKGIADTAFARPLDLQQGPDGALYYLNYSCGTWYTADKCTGIYRIEYKGSCQDPSVKLEQPVALDGGPAAAGRAGQRVGIGAGRISVGIQGGYAFALYGTDGRMVRSFSSEGPKEYEVASLLKGAQPGLYVVRVEDAAGVFTGRVAYFP